MDYKELNSILMDSFKLAEHWFASGLYRYDMTLKQRREVYEKYHGEELYQKLSVMNLGTTSSASRIMLLNLQGRIIKP